MTLAEHRNELLSYMPEEVRYERIFDAPPTWLNDKINEAYRRIHQDHLLVDITETSSIAAGNYYVDLPSDFMGMISVGYKSTGDNFYPLLPMQVPSHYYPSSTGDAKKYSVLPGVTNKLILDRVASNAFYLRYIYFIRHTTLSSDSSESTIPDEYQPVILHYVLQRMFRRLGMRNEALDEERLFDKEWSKMQRRIWQRNAETAPQERPLVEVGADGVRYQLWPGGPWSDERY